MLCKRPYAPGGMPLAGCGGHCIPCRINKKREWTARILLESMDHGDNCFVTLTYNNRYLRPYYKCGSIQSLQEDEIAKYMKRLRKLLDDDLNKKNNPNNYKCFKKLKHKKIRYFAVGEYGTNGVRCINPHYHLIIFGIGIEHKHYFERAWSEKTKELCWKDGRIPFGFVSVGFCEKDSAQYVAGYTVKKFSEEAKRYKKLKLYPEFARMSQGIGKNSIKQLAAAEFSEYGYDDILEEGDVKGVFECYGKKWPVGRYLKEKLREEFGFNERIKLKTKNFTKEEKERLRNGETIYQADYKACPKKTLQIAQKLHRLSEEIKENPKISQKTIAQRLVVHYKGKRDRLEKRQKIFKQRKTL